MFLSSDWNANLDPPPWTSSADERPNLQISHCLQILVLICRFECESAPPPPIHTHTFHTLFTGDGRDCHRDEAGVARVHVCARQSPSLTVAGRRRAAQSHGRGQAQQLDDDEQEQELECRMSVHAVADQYVALKGHKRHPVPACVRAEVCTSCIRTIPSPIHISYLYLW